jgi:hypothetical protein
MAKKRKNTRKKVASKTPEHVLPAGFWGQVGAVLLVAVSLLLVVAWFGVGGPVLEWLQKSMIAAVGYTVYVMRQLAVKIQPPKAPLQPDPRSQPVVRALVFCLLLFYEYFYVFSP